MDLKFATNEHLDTASVMNLIRRSMSKRKSSDAHRLVRIVPEANVVVTCRDGDRLVGLARGLKEVSGCCYLSDLVVDSEYADERIGEQLIRRVRREIGENSLIVLVPAPDAMAYSAEIE